MKASKETVIEKVNMNKGAIMVKYSINRAHNTKIFRGTEDTNTKSGTGGHQVRTRLKLRSIRNPMGDGRQTQNIEETGNTEPISGTVVTQPNYKGNKAHQILRGTGDNKSKKVGHGPQEQM